FLLFLFNTPATTSIYTLSLHDALPISFPGIVPFCYWGPFEASRKIASCRSRFSPSEANFGIGEPGLTHEGHFKWRIWKSMPSFRDRKSTRLNSSHVAISYAVFCLKKKK